MRVLIFGASGMVGQGVLRECLLDPGVTDVLSVSRTALPAHLAAGQAKLRELVRPDLFALQDFTPVAEQLNGFDACYFPLGVSSTRVTRDLTLAVARVVVGPKTVFVYVSGEGTDADSKTMWARVKGSTENELLAMPFKAAYMFRPGGIISKNGASSKVPLYNAIYKLFTPLIPLLQRLPKYITDTETVGRAMLRVTRTLPAERVWNTAAINRIGRD
jgi:uncharacterized protein YbjT (DUF2867 family)